MAVSRSEASYLLGGAYAEHDRLIRQALILKPFTERLFQDAGIAPGQQVLDIGSGVGDVTILAANLVGPSGSVVGIERDPATLATARSRAAKAGLTNVEFVEADVSRIPGAETFDAVVGRLILEYLPNASDVLRALAARIRPGGLMVFQDACWGPLLQLSEPMPLRAKCASLIYHSFKRSGAHMDMELVLFRTLQEAGLPSPTMRIEIPVGNEPDIVNWVHDLFRTLLPRMTAEDLAGEMLADLDTLQARLEEERVAANCFGACVGLVGAWSRKPV